MFRLFLSMFILTGLSTSAFTQIAGDAPMEETEIIQLTAADIFQKFPKNPKLNIYDLPNKEAALSLLLKHRIYAMDNELFQQFFTIPNFNSSTKYYPYTAFDIALNVTVYITLQDNGTDLWTFNAYTFSKDYEFISQFVLAQTSKSGENIFKSQWNTDNSILITTQTQSEIIALNKEKSVLKGTMVSKIGCNEQGLFSKAEIIEQKGLSVNTNSAQEAENLPYELYFTGNILKTVEWSDKFGKHFALVSYANTNNEKSTDLLNVPITLYFYHYAKKAGEKKYSITHQSKINVKPCDLQSINYFANEQIFYFTDIDNNEILEVIMPYFMSCRSENVAQIPMQILLWEGHRDFIQLVNIDVKNKKADYSFNSAWQRLAEPIRKHTMQVISHCAENSKI